MKVKELIKKLKEVNPENYVMFYEEYSGSFFECTNFNLDEDGDVILYSEED